MPKAKTCARCMEPTPATTVGSFSYEGVPYEIPLCDPHATMFDRDMVGWLRLASEVEPPKAVQPLQTARRYEGGPPIKFLIPKAPPREVILDDDPEPPEPQFTDFAMEFDLTYHARQRMHERGISRAEVYQLLGNPAKTRTAGNQEGTHVYRTRDLRVVVNEEARTVLTAAREKELI